MILWLLGLGLAVGLVVAEGLEQVLLATAAAGWGLLWVSLVQALPMLADAVNNHRTWLSDFADDEVTISNDLYEIILAYQHFTRPSA